VQNIFFNTFLPYFANFAIYIFAVSMVTETNLWL